MAISRHNPFDEGYFQETELREFGFRSVGSNVRISKNCTIIGLHNISLGSNVRIDDRVGIAAASNHVEIGSYVHIASGCHLSGAGGIRLADFSGLSHGVRLYSVTDDYSGDFLTNPTVPKEFLGVELGQVILEKHVIIGSGSVVLPGCTIGEGSSVGALSLVKKSLDSWGVYFGCPVRRLKDRSRRLLELERDLLLREQR